MGKHLSKSATEPVFDRAKSVTKAVAEREKNRPVCLPEQIHPSLQTDEHPQREKKGPVHFVEHSILVWLDASLDHSTETNRKNIDQFRRVTHLVQTFSDLNKCLDFLRSVDKENLFVVVSGSLGPPLCSSVDHLEQVRSIYIYCGNKSHHQEWTKAYRRVREIHTQMKSLCEDLRRDIRLQDNSLTAISLLPNTPVVESNEASQEFLFLQVIKTIILEGTYDEQSQKTFLQYVRPFYLNNLQQLALITQWKDSYEQHSPLWWYTRKCFLYFMLRKAFQSQDVELIVQLAFFIRDLHRDIKKSHLQTHNHQFRPISVYRAAQMAPKQLENIQKHSDGLLAFNDFLLTNLEKGLALKYAEKLRDRFDSIGVLYTINVDPKESSIPYIAVQHLAYGSDNDGDVLLSMNTIFHIDQITQLSNRLYEISLRPVNKKDELVKHLVEYIRDTTTGLAGWYKLARLMMEMKAYHDLAYIYQSIFDRTDQKQRGERAFLQHELGYLSALRGDLAQSINHYKQSIAISALHLSPADSRLLPTYTNLAAVLRQSGDLDGAIEYYRRALSASPPDSSECFQYYNSIGSILQQQDKHTEAQETYKAAAKILQNKSPLAHPLLAENFHQMASMFYRLKDYSNALIYCQKTLELDEKYLPSNHVSFSSTYFNLATVYEGLHDWQKARDYAEKAVQVARTSYGNDHAETKENVDYLQRLSS